jgi:hypothetical protein
VSQRLVGPCAFLLENCILHSALFEHGGSAAPGCRTEIVFVFIQSCFAHNRVGERASVVNDVIRVLFRRRQPPSHCGIEISALGLQASVGIGTLW